MEHGGNSSCFVVGWLRLLLRVKSVKGLEFRVPTLLGCPLAGESHTLRPGRPCSHPGVLKTPLPNPGPQPSNQPVPPVTSSLKALPKINFLPFISLTLWGPVNSNCNKLEPQTKSLNILTTKSHKLWAQLPGKWWAWLRSPDLRSDGINLWGMCWRRQKQSAPEN